MTYIGKVEQFIYQLEAYNTNLAAFLGLFNTWDRMSVEEREEVIDKVFLK